MSIKIAIEPSKILRSITLGNAGPYYSVRTKKVRVHTSCARIHPLCAIL